jgi:hypothetical protein
MPTGTAVFFPFAAFFSSVASLYLPNAMTGPSYWAAPPGCGKAKTDCTQAQLYVKRKYKKMKHLRHVMASR